MATIITQNLLGEKLQQRQFYFRAYPLNNFHRTTPFVKIFYSMHGFLSGSIYTNSTASVYAMLDKLVNGSWSQIGYWEIIRYLIPNRERKSFEKNLDPGLYKFTAYAEDTQWFSEEQVQSIYATYYENHIKGNKLRLINNSFTGYEVPSRNTIITTQKLNNGQVCTY